MYTIKGFGKWVNALRQAQDDKYRLNFHIIICDFMYTIKGFGKWVNALRQAQDDK
jgi:hypothetical protein